MSGQWLFSKKGDLLLLFLPVWLMWIVAFLLPPGLANAEMSLSLWIIFVLGIDVSHVWSTIYRTYLDSEERKKHKTVLLFAPLAALALALSTAYFSMELFWRVMAYIAVFHFIKQQYGFMRIYKAKARDSRRKWLSDNLVIYLSMLYPVIYWHFSTDRAFVWFAAGDFIQPITSPDSIYYLNQFGNPIYLAIMLAWLITELYVHFRHHTPLPIAKILWILTTAINWYLGIVFFNSDLIFTITNVVAHGVPYLALIVFYVYRKRMIKNTQQKTLTHLFMMILGGVTILAITEELLWNHLVYQDPTGFMLSSLQFPHLSETLQWIAVGVLAVPQLAHYFIDGFIWKNNEKNPYLKKVLFA